MTTSASASTGTSFVATAPAVAAWEADDKAVKYLGYGYPEPSCQVVAEICFDAAQNAAFFKLRIPVGLKGVGKKINVYLFIRPEHVLELRNATASDDTLITIPEPVQSAFVKSKHCASAKDVVALRFSMSRPGSAIGPAGTPALPKSNASANVLEALESLVRASQLTIYVPAKAISFGDLDLLCERVRDGGLVSAPKESSLDMLYAGKGGVDLFGSAGEAETAESPPSYDEIALTPPPPRKRAPANRSPPQPKKKTKFEESDQVWKSAVDEQLVGLAMEVAEMKKEMRELAAAPAISETREESPKGKGVDLATRLERVEREIQALREQTQRSEQTFQEKLDEVARRITEDVTSGFEERLDDELEDVRNDCSEQIDVKVDDRLLDIREELHDLVKEEMKGVEDSIKDSLRNALLSIDFD